MIPNVTFRFSPKIPPLSCRLQIPCNPGGKRILSATLSEL
jgi:hypothetical protein